MSEENNEYISSRGILKSCEIFSETPVSSVKKLINYKFKLLKNECTMYVCGSALSDFINNYIDKINCNFVLVCGDCDETIPNDILNQEEFLKFIENDKLIHMFCQNLVFKHPKLTIIPIGLDYHTLTAAPLWGPITSCIDQEKILNSLIKKSKPFWERNIMCYSNFHFSMKTKYAYDRLSAIKFTNRELVYYEPNIVPRINTWNNQIKYSFCICPHGGGLDCHRNWEALCLGCIPIVKTSDIDGLYKDLPVLIVKEWSEISQELLNETIIKFKSTKFNYNKLKLNYWINLIKRTRKPT
jgi:hypothetical protein